MASDTKKRFLDQLSHRCPPEFCSQHTVRRTPNVQTKETKRKAKNRIMYAGKKQFRRRKPPPGIERAAALIAPKRTRSFLLLVVASIVTYMYGHHTSWMDYDIYKIQTPDSSSSSSTAMVQQEQPVSTPFGGRPIDPILVKSLAKVQGPRSNNFGQDEDGEAVGWNVNPTSILESTRAKSNDFQCNWQDFVSTAGKSAKMCCHDDADMVSRTIKADKRFRDCDVLPKLWNESNDKTPNSVYLEIGANIGSCVMEMLLSTDAKVVAFEPHPYNQLVLQKSIQALDQSYQRRFVLIPVALGKETSKSKIYASSRNMGNSVVGKVIKDRGDQKTEDFKEFDIHIERLSSILDANAGIDFPLVKMDAQGFECQILDGIDPNLAKVISKIKLEVAPKGLREQQCEDLFSQFRNLGFLVRQQGRNEIFEGEAHTGRMMYEAIASKS